MNVPIYHGQPAWCPALPSRVINNLVPCVTLVLNPTREGPLSEKHLRIESKDDVSAGYVTGSAPWSHCSSDCILAMVSNVATSGSLSPVFRLFSGYICWSQETLPEPCQGL